MVYTRTLCFIPKNQPHKQHIWFLPTHKPKLKKPKELFLANALTEIEKKELI
jgi:hypothetical protein